MEGEDKTGTVGVEIHTPPAEVAAAAAEGFALDLVWGH